MFLKVQAEDGRSFQIEAPNLVIQQPEVIDEEDVDENYDPSLFLQSGAVPMFTPMYQPEYKEPAFLQNLKKQSSVDESTIITGTIDVRYGFTLKVNNDNF